MKAVRNFIKRFDTMANNRSKEMRLSFEEARELMSAISYLMSKKLENNESDDEYTMDGGTF